MRAYTWTNIRHTRIQLGLYPKMNRRRGVSAWAYCLVAILMTSASNLVASANNASCATEDMDLCTVSHSVRDALSVSEPALVTI